MQCGSKSGKNVRLKAKSFRSIAKFNDVYRTRNGKLLEDIQNNIINADRKIELAAHVSAYADQPLELKLSTVEEVFCLSRGACVYTGT